jgi:hypothetical protein
MYTMEDVSDDIYHNPQTGCRRVHLSPYYLSKAQTIEYYFGGIFRLRNNLTMTPHEHDVISKQLKRVSKAIVEADSYIIDRKIPTHIFKPQNQWADLIVEGWIPGTSFNNLNWTRILSPFTGYHLLYLDRLDHGRRFSQPYPPEVLDRIQQENLPDDLPDLMERYIYHNERLAWVVPQFFHSIRNLPSDLIVSVPPRGGEIGAMINGRIINCDSLQVQARVNSMHSSGVMDLLREKAERRGRVRVLEIGAGYGALAHAMSSLFRDRIDYVMVDLPSVLHYPATYLTLAGLPVEVITPENVADADAGGSHRLVPNYLLPEIEESLGSFDLVVNTMSMNEMSESQVWYYANLINRLLASDGVFYEENAVSIKEHIDCRVVFAQTFRFRRRVQSFHVAAGLADPNVWASTYVPQIYDRWDWSLP